MRQPKHIHKREHEVSINAYFIILLTTVLTITACGQKQAKMSDAQFDGLKDKIKTVRYENILYDENGNIFRKKEEIYFVVSYNKDGKKTERMSYVNNVPTVKTIYWDKEGETFSKDERLNIPEQTDALPLPPPPARNTTSEETTAKDASFDMKIKVTYDTNGNLAEKVIYGNIGQVYNRRVYEYDKNRNKMKETVFSNDGRYNDSTKYTYDSKGNLVQETTNLGDNSGQESRARPNHKLNYIYVKFDEKGNWLERKVLDSINNKRIEGEAKLVRIEYQTITYY